MLFLLGPQKCHLLLFLIRRGWTLFIRRESGETVLNPWVRLGREIELVQDTLHSWQAAQHTGLVILDTSALRSMVENYLVGQPYLRHCFRSTCRWFLLARRLVVFVTTLPRHPLSSPMLFCKRSSTLFPDT